MTLRRMTPVALIALILFASAGSPATAQSRACAVTGLEGDAARYWSAGAWSDLESGLNIPIESIISTGPTSRVEVTCDDGTVLTIGVATEVNLEQLAGPETSIVLQLLRGVIGVVAPERSWRSFEIRTPLAIASVRSTEWLVEFDAEAGAAVFVRSGVVVVRLAEGGAVSLAEGEGITVTPDGVAGEVKVWGPPRIEKSAAALGFGWR